MAYVTPRIGRLLLLALFCGAAFISDATAALVEPLDGRGQFHTYVDVVNRWRTDEVLDVLVLVSVANGDLKCELEEGDLVGRLRVEVVLSDADGLEVTRTRLVRTPVLSGSAAASQSLRQVFGVVLRDVPFRTGQIRCTVVDVNRRQTGLLNAMRKQNARSEAAGDWYAGDGPRPHAGVALDDPLFLVQAPLKAWNPASAGDVGEDAGGLHDYVHPSRVYGLEQDHLQIAQPVWPAAGGAVDPADLAGLRVQVTGADGVFALTDTVRFDERGRAALEAGRPAALFYELDVNRLPEGSYHLSLAPLGSGGPGVVAAFNVVWRLTALSRHHDLVLGEGRTFFSGGDLERFLAGSPSEREFMLEAFWERLNTAPEGEINPAKLEFEYRLAYVQQFLGGFGPGGAVDARGEVFLLLGPPDEVQREPVPLNFRDQDDARIKVYDRWAPDRGGTSAKGAAEEGSQGINPYDSVGGIPMPYSRRSESGRESQVRSADHQFGFELWKYDNGGTPLFVNRLSGKGMGQRFLFVDRTGAGDYRLDSSNVVQGEE